MVTLKRITCAILLFDRLTKSVLFLNATGSDETNLKLLGGEILGGELPEQAIARCIANTVQVIDSGDYDGYQVKKPTLCRTLDGEEETVHMFCSPLQMPVVQLITNSGNKLVMADRALIERSALPEPDRQAVLDFFDNPIILTDEELAEALIAESKQAGWDGYHHNCHICEERAVHERRVEVYRAELMARLSRAARPVVTF